jgi:hypothetical protein
MRLPVLADEAPAGLRNAFAVIEVSLGDMYLVSAVALAAPNPNAITLSFPILDQFKRHQLVESLACNVLRYRATHHSDSRTYRSSGFPRRSTSMIW